VSEQERFILALRKEQKHTRSVVRKWDRGMASNLDLAATNHVSRSV
jgi:hypothetical protein